MGIFFYYHFLLESIKRDDYRTHSLNISFRVWTVGCRSCVSLYPKSSQSSVSWYSRRSSAVYQASCFSCGSVADPVSNYSVLSWQGEWGCVPQRARITEWPQMCGWPCVEQSSSQHQGECVQLLQDPLGMLIDPPSWDKQEPCVWVHLGTIKSTGFWWRAFSVTNYSYCIFKYINMYVYL